MALSPSGRLSSRRMRQTKVMEISASAGREIDMVQIPMAEVSAISSVEAEALNRSPIRAFAADVVMKTVGASSPGHPKSLADIPNHQLIRSQVVLDPLRPKRKKTGEK